MNLEAIVPLITPIGGLWVIHSTIFSSAEFVNKMRETVVTGLYDGHHISSPHRKAMLVDWVLCMLAVEAVCFMFSGIIIAAAVFILTGLFFWIALVIASYPLLCGVFFGVCSVSDFRLMRHAALSKT